MPAETLYVMIGVSGPIVLITAVATILAHWPDKKAEAQEEQRA